MTGKQINKRVLNVNAKIIKPQLLTDQIQISGSLMPDVEVDLSFETSGKIVEINFDEGTTVKKGQLLAKVNDRQVLVELQDVATGPVIAGRSLLPVVVLSLRLFLRQS